MNVYRYVGNNPINARDPLGLTTMYVTDTSGNTKPFVDLTNAKARDVIRGMPAGSIKGLEFTGHGSFRSMSVNDDGGSLVLTDDGVVRWDDMGSSFSDDVRDKMASDATIKLNGCNTANKRRWFFGGADNISKSLSKELRGIAVQCNRGFGSKWNEPFGFRIGRQTHVAGFTRTYLDGIEK